MNQIFISSVQKELAAERKAIRDFIRKDALFRDYFRYQSDASVQIYVFSDRVEVWNPGELPPSLTPAKLRQTHASVPRNKRISEALFLANYIDKVGTGTLDVIAKCREAGLPEPEFFQDGDQFTVRIWRDPFSPAAIDQLGLNERQQMALTFVRESGRITNADFRKLTEASERTALRDLDEMVTKGVFEKSAKSGRSAGYLLASKSAINPPKAH